MVKSQHTWLLPILMLVITCYMCIAAASASAWEATCGIDTTPLRPGPGADPVEVLDLQVRLKDLHYYSGALNGIYGPDLEQSVRRFQKEKKLQADGVVGEATWAALASDTPVAASTTPKEKPQGNLRVVIDTRSLRLTLYADDKPYKTYPVAVGDQKDYNWTPVGDWKIVNKGMWGGGFGTRWMGLNVPWGTYGIHGTNKPYSIGTRASHGCIRMYNRDVEELYSWVPLGTPVTIIGVSPPITLRSQLTVGASGKDVVLLQRRLQQLGFATEADGRYGASTENSIRRLQSLYGLPADGKIYSDVYYILGLK